MSRVLGMQVNRTVGRCQGIAARAVAAIAAVMVAGCVTPGEATRPSVSSATIRYIEPAEARDLQISRAAQVVNIGEQVNFDRRRIADSIWIPIDKLTAFASDAPGKVIVYDAITAAGR